MGYDYEGKFRRERHRIHTMVVGFETDPICSTKTRSEFVREGVRSHSSMVDSACPRNALFALRTVYYFSLFKISNVNLYLNCSVLIVFINLGYSSILFLCIFSIHLYCKIFPHVHF